MFQAGDEVLITRCADDPRAAGRTGFIIDEEPPGELTGHRWTVGQVGWLIGTVLCPSSELRLHHRNVT